MWQGPWPSSVYAQRMSESEQETSTTPSSHFLFTHTPVTAFRMPPQVQGTGPP